MDDDQKMATAIFGLLSVIATGVCYEFGLPHMGDSFAVVAAALLAMAFLF